MVDDLTYYQNGVEVEKKTDTAAIAIAQQIRQFADSHTHFVIDTDQAAKLIESYGRQEYLRGVEHGTNHPWREDMGR